MSISQLDPTQTIKQYALELGFDDIGIASATEGTPYSEEYQQAVREGRFAPLSYMETTVKERSDVQQLMPGARSVVVVIKNYYTGDHKDFIPLESLHLKAKVSRYAWGKDYHPWFKKRLRKIRQFLHQTLGEKWRVHIFNDTGPVLERGWAERAGLGFIGKSGMFIHRRYGTWTFLGGFVTDFLFSPDVPTEKQLCGTCTACLDACPTKAIIAPRQVDARRCISTWNIERPLWPEAQADHLKGQGWGLGCDVCQEVCPWNKFESLTDEKRFYPLEDHAFLTPENIQGPLEGTSFARPKREGLLANLLKA